MRYLKFRNRYMLTCCWVFVTFWIVAHIIAFDTLLLRNHTSQTWDSPVSYRLMIYDFFTPLCTTWFVNTRVNSKLLPLTCPAARRGSTSATCLQTSATKTLKTCFTSMERFSSSTWRIEGGRRSLLSNSMTPGMLMTQSTPGTVLLEVILIFEAPS